MNVTGETGSVEEVRESQFKDLYMERNRNIIKLLDELDSDVICLQEFWVDSQELVDLYQSHFSQRYSWSQLERTGQRGDGLVTLVKNNIKVVIHPFRVAEMTLPLLLWKHPETKGMYANRATWRNMAQLSP